MTNEEIETIAEAIVDGTVMAKDLIQELMKLHTVEAATLRHKLVTLSATLRDWSIENPPPATEKHRAVNEMIEALLDAQEMLQYPMSED